MDRGRVALSPLFPLINTRGQEDDERGGRRKIEKKRGKKPKHK